MKRAAFLAIAVAALTAATALSVACGKEPPPVKPPAAAVEKTEWTSDEVAADPEGYLRWADRQIQAQIKQRDDLLKTVAARREMVQARQQKVVGELPEWESFLKRLETAFRRAEDEGRWPVQVGNRKFERDKAVMLLEQLPKQIELRRPLADEYVKALKAMDERSAQLRSEVEALNQLREKVALDVERVQLSRGVDDMAKLTRSSAEIAHFAGVIGTVVEVPAATGGETGLIPLETLIGK